MKTTIYECQKCKKVLEVIIDTNDIIKDELMGHYHYNDKGWNKSERPTKFKILKVKNEK